MTWQLPDMTGMRNPLLNCSIDISKANCARLFKYRPSVCITVHTIKSMAALIAAFGSNDLAIIRSKMFVGCCPVRRGYQADCGRLG